ncbi:MAG: hypothetical protein JXR55_04210 [Candidatus Fermentibacteraceae bacterium]|nr:hypothetical protein [Candidatus Fermentibacteraceae bacterium]
MPEGSKAELRHAAGTIARYSVLHPCDSLRPVTISEDGVMGIMETCERNPEAWAYFYACVVDTINKLEPPEPACQEMGFERYSEEEIQNLEVQ